MKKYIQIFILTGLIFFSFQSSSYSQWFKLPDLPDSAKLYNMYFANANTGWITSVLPQKLFKTTNGGMNWILLSNINIRTIQFIDTILGYATGYVGTTGTIWKSSDGGLNWNSLFISGNSYADLFFVNKDTGWVCGFDGFYGKIWRTNDGANNWFLQYTAASNGLDRIFFLKNKVNGEYWGWTFKGPGLWRSTNSGVNWILINNNIGGCNNSDCVDIYFKDTSDGIITRAYECFNITTNGGYNWIIHSEMNALSSKIGIGDDHKIWLTLSADSVIKTTNFFQSYGKQNIPAWASHIFAVDTTIVYAGYNKTNMIKTTNGGGPIIYLGIDSLNLNLPAYYRLYQNYPNPFNPATTIIFDIRNKGYINLTIYDIAGREVLKLFNNNFLAFGTYKTVVDFGKLNISSGVYLYRLSVTGANSKSIYMETKKMIYLR